MKVVVQQRERVMYLGRDGQWRAVRSEAAEFSTVVEAIMFCIRSRAREIRLLVQTSAGEEIYLYPFGGDPAVKRELRNLRKSIRENRRLRTERRIIRARIDSLMAEGKEKKKQFPFKRTPLGDDAPAAVIPESPLNPESGQ